MGFAFSLKVQAVSLAALALGAAAGAQTASVRTNAHPTARILAKIDNALTTQLPGSHPVFGADATVGGRVASTKLMPHLKLVLTSSAEQEAALQQLMGEQQDKNSANYHKWLTPDAFGTYFGPAQADIAKVTAWLSDQGMSVERVANGGRVLLFTGSVAQVEATFHTEIHSVQVNGEAHISNTTDLFIPEALAGVVAGVARVNDIFPSSSPGKVSTVQLEAAKDGTLTGNPAPPLYGTATGTHYITPGDAAVIYNTTPLTAAGIDGTGQTISILARSNIDLADVQEFRSIFGLKKNDPTVIVAGQDPGLNGDDTEAYLDAEWGGALAPGAAVNFIVSSASLESGGTDGAALYAVENNVGDIISLSYGGGEPNFGASGTAFWNSLWEQASAQGQTVFISTGDSGAATCDSSSAAYATHGYCVNALGSSAYNVAMGGSIFIDFNPAQYWGASGGTSVPFVNALSYVPEGALNQGRLSNDYPSGNGTAIAYTTGSGIFADGGGISIYTPRPSWQTGSGIPNNADAINVYSGTGIAAGSPISGLHRLVPDLSNISANGHDGTLFCAGSICSVSNTNTLNNAGIVGGTSVATPVQAGIQALINQKNGGRQGNILPILYSLANAQYTASTTACQVNVGSNSTSTPTLPASTCNFHDIIYGSNVVPTASSGTAGIGFSAGVGFDEATGLGSMNVANVANNWSTVSLVPTSTTFTLSPTLNVAHGAAQILKVTVAPSGGSGTPSGDIALVAETSAPNGPFQYTLSSGAFSGAVSSAPGNANTTGFSAALPAGSYNVHVHYAGDGTYAPSDSASVPVTISKESTTVSSSSYNVSSTGSINGANTFVYGAEVYIDTYVIPVSNSGTATGTVTYSVSRNGSTIGTVTGTLDGYGNTYFLAGQAYPNYYLKPNFNALTPGTYIVTATYSGDGSLNTSSTTTSFTVTQLTPTVTFTVPASITSGATAVFGYSIVNPATAALPNTTVAATGTVFFVDTTTSSNLGSCSLASGVINGSNLPSATCTFSTTGITASGANTITATYSGDPNYATLSTTGTVTVGTLTASTLALTSTSVATVGAPYTLTATMTPAAATGTVSFFDSAKYLGQATLSSGVASLAVGSAAAAGGGILTAGSHSFSATYSGSTTYSSSTGTYAATIAKNTTAITLSAPSSSTYGQNVIFSVYLTRSPTTSVAALIQPTGVVNFSSDGTVVASGALNFDPAGYGYYAAAASTTTLPAGTHTITATYVGDSNFNTSTAALTPTITVAQLTPTVTLSSTANVYSGTSVTLTATIPLPAALAAPTGMVSFYNGNSLLGSVTATYSASAGGYVATYTATSQTTGTHNYKAVLAGDTNYVATVSNTLSVLFNANNVWVANGNGTVSALTNTGTALTPAGVSQGGTAIAIDGSGDVWSLNKSASKVSEYDNSGNLINTYTGGGVSTPTALAIDGSGLVWVTNATGTLSTLSPTGAVLSPSAGYKVSASGPTSINIDGSGNLWITNAGDNTVTEVIGAATPVTTPTTNAVKTNTLAAKP